MKLERNTNVIYRAALEAANADLAEISAEFERLTVRKDRIEKLLAALKPFVAMKEEQIAGGTPVASQTPQQSTPVEAPSEQVREAEPMAADPFRRRVDHVLGIGAGIRDVRQYTRQF